MCAGQEIDSPGPPRRRLFASHHSHHPPFTLLVIPAPHPPPRAPKSQGSSTRGWEVCAGLALVECMERESKDAGAAATL